MVTEKTIAEDKETLNRLMQKVNELFVTYKTVKQLLEVDTLVIRRTVENNSKIIYPFKMTRRLPIISSKGGVASFIFRRRARRMFEDVISTCYLYISFEKDSEKKEMAQKVIEELKKDETSIIFGTTASKKDRLKLPLEVLSIILGIVTLTLPLLSNLINQTFSQIPFSSINDPADVEVFIVSIVSPIIAAVLEIPLVWWMYKYRWYQRVIYTLNLHIQEMEIYDELLLLQKKVSPSPLLFLDWKKVLSYEEGR